MKPPLSLCLTVFLSVGLTTFSQPHRQSDLSPFTLSVTPGAIVPLGSDTSLFTYGYGILGSGTFRMPFLPQVSVSADVGFQNYALRGNLNPLAGPLLLSAGAGVGISLEVIRGLFIHAFGKGGYYYGFLIGDVPGSSFNPYAAGGIGISYRFTPFLSLGLESSHLYSFGLCNSLILSLGLSFQIYETPPSTSGPGEPPMEKGPAPSVLSPLEEETARNMRGGLQIDMFAMSDIFPIFYKYYNDHPIGKVTLHNWGKTPVDNITLSFVAKQYMENPKTGQAPRSLQPGEVQGFDLYGLFKNTVLDISEPTLVSANFAVDYTLGGKPRKLEFTKEIRILDRNAMTWDDDRRAAAFVTAKDPTVLKFAKNVNAMLKGRATGAVDANLLAAMGIHQALVVYGLSYVVDPTTPHAVLSQNKTAADFLQFPQQTLEYKAGDCDDLSILYCAILESIGVPTAFITIPGHIYMAFSLTMPPDQAKKTFLKPEDLIFQQDRSWVPIEVTQRDGGFMKAWEIGAKEWRENKIAGTAVFYPTQDCWAKYEPVGFSGAAVPLNLPAENQLIQLYTQEVARFIDREIGPKVAALQADIGRTQDNTKLVNRLAVLYAQYGMYDRAEKELTKIAPKNYVPALINLGNIQYMRNDPLKALGFYQQAQKKEPSNPKVLLGLARAFYDLDRRDEALKAYGTLKGVDPETAAKFDYLEVKGQDATRAADVSAKGVMTWVEE